jgi:hypothetical protein
LVALVTTINSCFVAGVAAVEWSFARVYVAPDFCSGARIDFSDGDAVFYFVFAYPGASALGIACSGAAASCWAVIFCSVDELVGADVFYSCYFVAALACFACGASKLRAPGACALVFALAVEL